MNAKEIIDWIEKSDSVTKSMETPNIIEAYNTLLVNLKEKHPKIKYEKIEYDSFEVDARILNEIKKNCEEFLEML